ncbi:MAG: alpha/beta hydrolase, partial [Thermoanaerobaculia bacterium]
MNPRCELVRFEATDGVALAGLLFEPSRKSKSVVIFLHGTGGSSVFESKRTNVLAAEFVRAGVAYFPFNNRGAHVMRRAGNAMIGCSFERIRDCVFDIDGAVRELRRRGYRDITLAGHSTGANKIAVYDHYKPRNFVKRYVLLGGGDDTGLLYRDLGPPRFQAALKKARAMIKARRGDELVPPSIHELPMSWRAFYDMANPDGDYNVFPILETMRGLRLSRRPRFRYLRAIRKPALFLYGENDEYCIDSASATVAVLADALPNAELAILADADHGFGGKETELAQAILWSAGGRAGGCGGVPRRRAG